MRDIVHGIEIHTEPKAVFDTIATRSGLAAFWTPDVQGDDSEDGELSLGFSGSPARLPIRVMRLDQPRTIEWGCPGASRSGRARGWSGRSTRANMAPR
jgi:hypothetical protein